MSFVSRVLPFVVLILFSACRTDMSTSMPTPTRFDLNQAAARVRERVANIPPLAESDIAHVPDLDVPGWYAFSVLPRSTGLAGEVIYLVGPDEMLTAGTAADFNRIMQQLEVGAKPNVLDIEKFAHLFLRLRVLRHGVLLEKPDGHPLLPAGSLPASKFTPPQYRFDPNGANFKFWVFDTDRLEPVFWNVHVAPDGTTTFSETE